MEVIENKLSLQYDAKKYDLPMPSVYTGGVLLLWKSYMDVLAGPQKFDFLLYQNFTQLPIHQHTIFDIKAPNVGQIGCFLQ